MSEWKSEWPKKPGMYWFYGYPWRKPDRNEKPHMYLVTVHAASGNNLAYTTEGNMMYKAYNGGGKWMEAIVPEPPEGGV